MSGSRKMTNENIFKHRGLNNLSSFVLWKFAHTGKKKKDCTFHVTHHSCSTVFPKGHAVLCRMDFNILNPLDRFIPVDT